ncbi:phosphatase PAP2 family protein [Caenimonas aquaedulcis]|uniref:Phosphatase PAP2 family protein n=1 Tax=Caenimonas aquaedulcis TaxID=2793270 RepID=A0A931MFX2_9BURK|nr:phosphatase PAP2 family protein [Caenimonas aquaedulcis]MBG9387334.1 phosphatase PAP2 family protein [Caenimonas aquaedulcis]
MTLTPRAQLALTFAAALAFLAWDLTPFDMVIAGWSGTPKGFALRDNWWMTEVLHDAARKLSLIVWVASCVAVRWPFGPWKRLEASRRLQFAVTAGLAALAIVAIKSVSATSCPWDMAAFGRFAHQLSHWTLQSDGGVGHCFPSGHASSGFVYFAGYFAFRRSHPRAARAWFLGALLLGIVFGLNQQLRGAHFMSHTLWSAWVCWTIALALDWVWSRGIARRLSARP